MAYGMAGLRCGPGPGQTASRCVQARWHSSPQPHLPQLTPTSPCLSHPSSPRRSVVADSLSAIKYAKVFPVYDDNGIMVRRGG